MMMAPVTAALPMSLARLASGCRSVEM
jgi:hypothetical protein